ncbi:orotidine-5'-phosphate decarboxylase [Permianibacter sp. IMCC34836]|uniref:orotidine-5'-phosphate decarboxylase n=1 Tax=Permianibacter fluminis TaxID=2738515 RepID=UPI001554D8D5|nr:orotidine-5'-phosphate decarboxylase [Permianibacter fluminis]NQD37396.1 orotidine-5'-phosphate decarboxylase [Permianibacter fluminis]
MTDPKIIVALDYDLEAKALALADQLDPAQCRLKVGKEMFTKFGPSFVRAIQQRGFQVFLDLKFHDIPNTVAGAVKSAADLGVWMVNVHASGGPKMMVAAREALQSYGAQKPLLIAVTVLTSFDAEQLAAIGINRSIDDQVLLLAKLTEQAGLDGVVCSAREAPALRQQSRPGFALITPGIRPAGSAAGDQIRTLTPQEALAAGSSYLVIGRPITGAPDPRMALCEIADSL